MFLVSCSAQLAGDFADMPESRMSPNHLADGGPISAWTNAGNAEPRPSKRHRSIPSKPSWVQHWQDHNRGDAPFVSIDTANPKLLEETTLSALTSVFQTTLSQSGIPNVATPIVRPVSTVTHENLQLVFNREGIPLCGNGHDCATRSLPGGAILGPLNRYLYPEEQIIYDKHGAHALKDRFKATEGAPCLLCIRTMAQITKMAVDSTGSLYRRGGHAGVVLPPFTNLVDVPDGYRKSAMVVTPSDLCVAGGVWICGAGNGLCIKINKMKNQWFVDQNQSIVYGEEPTSSPFL